ncbi:RraA family protein [Streptomyces sp. NBC_01497]|uniref:RraA family protein n=1 Tax=Streptomyces sp. NBC_01497 TaxID=2903885 RepID=UPI002E31747E|nr:RraA family protein [Streptomyces sp. NBC_01497]
MTESEERLLALARQVGTADVVDAMGRLHRHRCHLLDLASPTPGRLLFGPVVTMSFFPTCEQSLPAEKFNFVDVFDEAVRDAGPGMVLVMASNGYPDVSMGGGTKISRVAGKGLAGVLAEGRLRDFDELAGYGMAVYCAGESVKWGGDTVTPFEVNRPVVVGGVGVRPGDHVFADGSGGVVIPRGQVRAVLEDACRTKESEARLAAEWSADTDGDD